MAKPKFGISGAVPDFLARATGIRRLVEEVEKRSGATYDDEASRNAAEVTVFLIAAAMAAHECGLPRSALIEMAAMAAADVWKETRRG